MTKEHTKYEVGSRFENDLNGYPIVADGRLIAVAKYLGGTETAKKNAELIVAALRAYTGDQGVK